MADKNLGLSIAESAVNSINSLNSQTRSIELYEKIRLAQEENDNVVKEQKRKAFSYGTSAAISIALSLIGQVFKNESNPLGDPLISLSKIAPEGLRTWSTTLDGSITKHSHESRVFDVASQRISQDQNTIESLIGRNVEQISRLLSKEI